MYRTRIKLPRGFTVRYRYLDALHDALINAWSGAGAPIEQVLGPQAGSWNFAVLGRHRREDNEAHSLIVSTPDLELARYLQNFRPESIRLARAQTAEIIDFSPAAIVPEPDPIPPGEGVLSLLMLSPVAIRAPGQPGKKWLKDLRTVDFAAVINHRLSRLAGRPTYLQAQADSLYLRANPDHSVLVPVKQNRQGRCNFVIGMSAPFVLAGSEADLRLAWYAGIGEKTRNGFGCLGLLERGVGR